MKTAFVVLLVILTGCTCNEIKEKLLPSFNVNIPEIQLSVPPLPKVLHEEIPVGALKTPINMDSAIKANTAGVFGADAVHLVKVKSLAIKALNANDNNNLSNFESARMRIYSDTAFTDIATIQFPTSYSDSITVIPENSPDITQYLKGTSLNYNLYWKNRKVTKKFLQLVVSVTVSVQ